MPSSHHQGCNHVFKVGGPVSWSRYYYPSTEKNRQVCPVWCNRLHNHTIHQKASWKLGGPSKFWGSGPPTPSGCAHAHYRQGLRCAAFRNWTKQFLFHRLTRTAYLHNRCLPWYNVVLTSWVHSSVKYSKQSTVTAAVSWSKFVSTHLSHSKQWFNNHFYNFLTVLTCRQFCSHRRHGQSCQFN